MFSFQRLSFQSLSHRRALKSAISEDGIRGGLLRFNANLRSEKGHVFSLQQSPHPEKKDNQEKREHTQNAAPYNDLPRQMAVASHFCGHNG